MKQDNQGIKNSRYSDEYSKGYRGVDDEKRGFSQANPLQIDFQTDPSEKGELRTLCLPQSSDLGNLQSVLGEDRSVSESSRKEQVRHKESNDNEKENTSDDGFVLSETSPQDADQIFKKMKETELIPNAIAMLDGFCIDGLIQEAMKLFGTMREKGTIPEVVIYTAAVGGLRCSTTRSKSLRR